MDEWEPLDLGDDPTPGDVAFIQSVSGRLREYAGFTRERTARLGEIANSGDEMSMDGDYAPIYRAHLRRLNQDAAVLEPAHTGCADALSAYAQQLEQCQLKSRTALQQGAEARYERNAANERADALEADAVLAGPESDPELLAVIARLRASADEAETRRQLARGRAMEAGDELEAAATSCATTIQSVKPSRESADADSDTQPLAGSNGSEDPATNGGRGQDHSADADQLPGHTVVFRSGRTANTVGKQPEYERQITGQINGVNRMTPNELIHNMDNARRGGLAQKQARLKWQRVMIDKEADAAAELEESDPNALGGLTPRAYAKKIVADKMKFLAALHNPDLAGGGADVIGENADGLPEMGDKYVNSSLGSQWSVRGLAARLRQYAENLITRGLGDTLLHVGWRLE